MDCVFCRIIKGELPSKKVLEDEKFLAIIPPHEVSPVHILCMPKKHVEKTDSISGIEPLWNDLFNFANLVIKHYGLDKTGYRIVNNGAGYQGIDHEHIHVLGGKTWRPNDNL